MNNRVEEKLMKWRTTSLVKVAAAALGFALPLLATESQAMPSFREMALSEYPAEYISTASAIRGNVDCHGPVAGS